MANFSPGNTVDMAEMRDNLGMPGGTVTLSGIKSQFYDAYWDTSLQPYAAFQTSGLWRYRLEISIPGAGFVQFTYPYSSAQGNQVTSLWFNALNYNYMSIYCQPYYPYTFQYWRYGYGGAIFAYNLAPNVNWNATNELVLYAVVA